MDLEFALLFTVDASYVSLVQLVFVIRGCVSCQGTSTTAMHVGTAGAHFKRHFRGFFADSELPGFTHLLGVVPAVSSHPRHSSCQLSAQSFGGQFSCNSMSQPLHATVVCAHQCHHGSWTATALAGRVLYCEQLASGNLSQVALCLGCLGRMLSPSSHRSASHGLSRRPQADHIPMRRSPSLRPQRILYNAAIAACGRALAWPASLALLSELRHQGGSKERVQQPVVLASFWCQAAAAGCEERPGSSPLWNTLQCSSAQMRSRVFTVHGPTPWKDLGSRVVTAAATS